MGKFMMTGSDQAAQYLEDAINAIDDRFGKNKALENPELVAAFMNVASRDFLFTSLEGSIDDLKNVLDDRLSK